MRVVGDVPLVGDEDDRVALAVQPLEPVTVDDVVVDRFIDGGMSWTELTREERIEAARRMDRRGFSRAVIAERTHLRSATLYEAWEAAQDYEAES